MIQRKHFIAICLSGFIGMTAYAAESSFLDACKKQCPKATTEQEAHDCAEKLEHGKKGKAFKKTKCSEANEAFEQQNKGAAGEEGEKHE